jgi:ParB family chromosome partitioning protein
VDYIRPNPRHPRREFNDRALDELAESIRTWGQLQPIVVRHDKQLSTYELICGERRWRAHQRAGLRTIWGIERDASDADALRLALVENFHRVDFSMAEKLAALDQLAELAQLTGLRRAAALLHIDPGWLSRLLAMRRDPLIYSALEAGQLGFGQAAELLRAPKHACDALLDRVLKEPSVATADIRAWVEEERAYEQQKRARIVSHANPDAANDLRVNPFRKIVTDLEQLGPPRSEEDRSALLDLFRRIQRLRGTRGRARKWCGPPALEQCRAPEGSTGRVRALRRGTDVWRTGCFAHVP